MATQNISLSKTLNPPFSPFKPTNPLYQTLNLSQFHHYITHKSLSIQSHSPQYPFSPLFPRHVSLGRPVFRSHAGRSRGDASPGRIEGSADIRRQAKRNARRKGKKLAESLFYRLKNPHKLHADNFTQEELEMIGLGYDRMVRFMEKDDPNLRHPYDWYKYGQFGPYSWRGVVLGDPIRGRFSDETVMMIGPVKNQEEWEKIEQFDMASDFGKRLKMMDESVGFRYFWVFVRHPRWRISEFPWQQWTLVSEVVLEVGKNQRLDKWSLMGRLGNKTRELITKCAAWMRPDIIYVKRPVYQCRFEPQADFFNALTPLLDPNTEKDFLFELKHDDGRVEFCTYFSGLCKIVRVNPKAFVDDVVKGYEKLSDENKSRCLEFLLSNNPVQLLHPYTKEWKAKLEEMELGCDAPDDSDVEDDNSSNNEIMDWIEDDGNEVGDYDGDEEDGEVIDMEEDQDSVVIDMKDGKDDKDEEEDDQDEDDEEDDQDEEYWDKEFKKALMSNESMEKLATKSVKISTKYYKKQLEEIAAREQTVEGNESFEEKGDEGIEDEGDEGIEDEGDEGIEEEKEDEDLEEEKGDEGIEIRGHRAKVSPEEWKRAGYGPYRRKVQKSKIPPELFLRAAVRPFTYRNLVKEIVLTRHAILDGDFGPKTDA